MPREHGLIRGSLLAGQRFVAIVVAFAPFALMYCRDRRRFLLFGRSRDVTDATRERRAASLRETLVGLGPTFIKFGQLLSTRPDVLSPAYVNELSRLQDDVPPADWVDTREVLEDELGPVEEVFDDFDTEAISGASLGQVYTATHEGERVAVKVRRPGVEALVEADLRVVRTLFPLVLWRAPPDQRFTLSNVTTEFTETIREEMDYGHEREFLETIRTNLDDEPNVVVPASVASRSTERVLTMQYVEGAKIDRVDELDAMGVDRSALAERLERCYIRMLVEDGVFHADPHPGNIAVQEDGTLVLYDFGMSGRIDAERREYLRECYRAVANDDIEGVVDAFVSMGALDPAADRAVVTDVLSLATEHLRGERVEGARIRDLAEGFEGTLHELPFRMPRDLALVVRVATVLEGVCRTLDPDFDFVAAVEDAVKPEPDDTQERIESALEAVGTDVSASARAALRVPQKLDRALDRADRDDLTVRTDVADENDVLRRLARRVVLGTAASAGIVVTTLCYTAALTDATIVAGIGTLGTLGLLYRSFSSSGRKRAVREAGQVAQRSLENRGRR